MHWCPQDRQKSYYALPIRSHRIAVHKLNEMYRNELFRVDYTASDKQAADIFTKSFTSSEKWISVMKLIGHTTVADYQALLDVTLARIQQEIKIEQRLMLVGCPAVLATTPHRTICPDRTVLLALSELYLPPQNTTTLTFPA